MFVYRGQRQPEAVLLHRVDLEKRRKTGRIESAHKDGLAPIVPMRLSHVAIRTALIGLLIGPAIAGEGLPDRPRAPIWFDIPSQQLADALVAFSAKTGLEIFYDGALSVGRRSTAVAGEFSPIDGLRILLRGTSYVAQATEDAGGVTISVVQNRPSEAMRRYESYFALLQANLSAALCELEDRTAGEGRIVVNLWLESSGVISRTDILGLIEYPDRRNAISAALDGLQIKQTTPAGLPQPVTMAIFPAAAGETTGCADTSRLPTKKSVRDRDTNEKMR
ncbi:STN domain-containing protein [Tardiphaga robiniae]|uniref:Secretin/TonB short N-terminal domain-containing protein n=1 Tax=Tardiphaga robiniae TaxID=943830 RepID=A0A163ZSQ1_9BRAD|nr:STN domain-containing protein [Tardiphaga robiniae]KZD23817.1 hypothetical protein A4A58_26115 [Tardiphaga robiniae]